MLLGARTLLGPPGLATRSKKLLGTKGTAMRITRMSLGKRKDEKEEHATGVNRTHVTPVSQEEQY